MPKKSRGKYKSYRPVSNYSEAEIFRNSSAVLDDTDPIESLRYLKEIFKDKLEEDVIVMIFSECAYNVDQACETLMSLANEGNVEQSLSQKSVDCSEIVNEANNHKIDPNPEIHYQNAFRDNEFNKSVEYLPDTRNASLGNWINNSDWPKKDDFIHKSEVQTNSLNHTHQNWIYQSSSLCQIPDNSELNTEKPNECVNDVKEGHSRLMPISPSAFSFGNQNFTTTSKPQFITPFLPTSSHKPKSGCKSPYSPENNQPHFCSLPNKQSSSLLDKGTKKCQKDALRYAIEKIQSGQNVLIILRGLPGSGKSSLARKMKFSGAVFSTDDFFYKKGKYAFDPNQLTEAHAWNKIRTRNALEKGVTPVIIDNTNTEVWEMVPYIFLGKKFNYEIVILEPNTSWKFNVKELAKRNKHHVSKEKIAKMKERYQRNVNVESIIQSLNLTNSEKSDLSTESDVVKFPVKDSRQIYSDNSESHDSSEEKGKSISFEAVIHQEEDPSDLLSDKAASLDDCMSYSQSSIDSSELPEINSTSSLINQDCDFNNKIDKHLEFVHEFESGDICGSLPSKDKTVYNLDELRALMREDSEESQSVSHNDSLNGSNQDVSCWESITEHDDDFLWRNTSCDIVENSLSNNELDFLRSLKENEDNKNDLSQSYEYISSKLSDLNLVEEDSFTNNFLQDVSEINIASAENLSDNKSHTQQSNLNSIDSAHEENCPAIYEKDKNITFNLNEENVSFNLNPKVCLLSFSKQADFADEQDFSHSGTRMSENYTSDSNIFDVNVPVRNEVAENSKLFQLKCAVDYDSNVKSSEIRNEISKNLEKKDELFNANNYSLQNVHSDLNMCVIEPLSITEETGTIKSDNFLEPTVPKPQRSGKNLPLMFSRNSANNAHMKEKLEILETPVTFDDSIEWETVSSKSDTPTDDNSSQNSNSEIENSPKPQRNIHDMQDVFKFKNKAQNSCDSGKVQNINDIKTEQNKEQNTNSPDARYSYNTKIWIPHFLKNVGEIDSDWKFPDFARHNIDKEEKEEENTISVKTSCTQTEPNDFVIICRLENGSLLDCPLEYRILICNESAMINELQEKCSSETAYDNIPQTAKFEKSTSTADLACDSEKYEKLSHLHECFPDISEEDLLHLLDICHGDESWLSNILLEWGYKYNVQNPKEKEVCANDVEKPKFNIDLSSDSNLKNSEAEICSIDNQEKSKKLVFNESFEECSDNLKKPSLLEMQHKNNTLSGNSSDPLLFKNMQLILDPAFAWQLEELFGPVTTHSSDGPLSASDRVVEIDMDFAKLIYNEWKKTSETKLKSFKKDESEKVENAPLFKNREFTSAELNVPLEKSSNESLSFSEIMDMQYALELHKQEKLKKDRNFETKLKRLKLYKMFPGADTVVLDEIFECNNCCLEDCVKALGEDFGEPKSARHKKDLEKIETCVTEWNESNIFQDFENDDWSDWVYHENNIETVKVAPSPTFEETISAEAARLRKIAAEQYVLRQECIKKAQTAYCRGMKDVASFYAQQGQNHGFQCKQANKKASELIAQERNISSPRFVLDLHGLYIQEAIPTLEKFLRDRKLELRRHQQVAPQTVSIVTGQGLHSIQGPKLRPSVMEYLKKTGYGFSEVNQGVLEVTLNLD